jgi:hypothetical protein
MKKTWPGTCSKFGVRVLEGCGSDVPELVYVTVSGKNGESIPFRLPLDTLAVTAGALDFVSSTMTFSKSDAGSLRGSNLVLVTGLTGQYSSDLKFFSACFSSSEILRSDTGPRGFA